MSVFHRSAHHGAGVNHRGCSLTVVLCVISGVGCHGPNASPRARSLGAYDVGAGPRSIATADLNGDGLRDVVVANSGDGTVTILLGVGAGRLGPFAAAIPCSFPRNLFMVFNLIHSTPSLT